MSAAGRTDDLRALGASLSNWGRWGDDDERGTTNLITPDKLVAAAKLIKTGHIFDLGIPFDEKGPQPGGVRLNPVRLMSETGALQVFPGGMKYADDYVFMPLQAASQWDALAHVYYDDQLYNGFPAGDVTVKGATHNAIDKQSKGIAGRGVLLDIAGLRGVDWLQPGDVIGPEDLEAAMERQGGVAVGSGDILLFRTGWRKKFLTDGDAASFMAGEPGLGQACCAWLRERDVAVVASDNWAIEALPGENPDYVLNVHMVLIRDMGMTLGEILDFEELTADCNADGIWEFFFCAPPLKFSGGMGSPINPLAIK
ncbi:MULTISPECIES: cyclase family protein [unclassified Mycobacterium]|uniref:cyclase family protein n=1 Tax=unclassified Mycobacterium TaxID=2642494 RepID=UPI00073FD7B6|nr:MULTISPECIES: cyclase family protein [unclassified Mycobacterium]KUH87741.1 cyclase [Mycobacterium sp. GA-0227b]KUH87788.1 cyclase [Mycobacterium sp. GA-1999]KUH88680.1 cyclase [Mycobacterium sp. IS-1556]